MPPELPNDVLSMILSYLPVKNLITLSLVCKEWNSIIRSSEFVSLQLKNSKGNNHSVISRTHLSPLTRNEEERVLVWEDDESFPNGRFTLIFHCQNNCCSRYLEVGVINGVICLSTYTDSRVILWNPITRRMHTILTNDSADVSSVSSGYLGSLGFGFDPSTHDFKVVHITCPIDDRRKVGPPIDYGDFDPVTGPGVFDIYSLEDQQWTSIVRPDNINFFILQAAAVFSNENFHWIAFCRYRPCFILTLSVHDKTVGEIGMPESLDGESSDDVKIGLPGALDTICADKIKIAEMKGCLALIQEPYEAMGTMRDIWILKEYGNPESWTRLFKVDDINSISSSASVIGMRKDGSLLLSDFEMLCSYNDED